MDGKEFDRLLEENGFSSKAVKDTIQDPLLSKEKRAQRSKETGKEIKSGGKILVKMQDDLENNQVKQQENVLE